MEDLAYIYLALNEESEQANSTLEAVHLQPLLSNWAPPIEDDRTVSSSSLTKPDLSPDLSMGTPKVHELDVDFNPHSCPSCFYL